MPLRPELVGIVGGEHGVPVVDRRVGHLHLVAERQLAAMHIAGDRFLESYVQAVELVLGGSVGRPATGRARRAGRAGQELADPRNTLLSQPGPL